MSETSPPETSPAPTAPPPTPPESPPVPAPAAVSPPPEAAPPARAEPGGDLTVLQDQVSDLTSRYEQARSEAATAQQRLNQLVAARAVGLPDVLADRLRGEDEQALSQDASAVLAAVTALAAAQAPAAAPAPAPVAPVRPVESLRPASPVGDSVPVQDTPEQIARLVWGKK
ncbi:MULTISPECIES: hypothetical protein [unclassified Crossiella]|uniref:hypothetical protein n=1 Tax=unclassified Crossiella TaxID=2620835 RepID=UPI001FFFE187|nr:MULTISPECIES: hypothetical protein [unclassified Crossiella]MCK2239393.1 hypothetical protein [Crossiella sp. S99.2]MCK2252088.1 hypothetical protein [Crossiella sp. S99.1]